MIESGVKDYVVNTWMGFAVPAGVPEPVVGKLNAELNRIGQLPAVREKMLAQGIEMLPPIAGRGTEAGARRPDAVAADHQGVGGVGGSVASIPRTLVAPSRSVKGSRGRLPSSASRA